MVTALLDTSILVDCLRGIPVAVTWLSSQTSVGVTRIVELEVIEGVRDHCGLAAAVKLLGEFDSIDLVSFDFDWARQPLVRYKLSHNVGMMDCLIASVSYRLQIPLYTTNLKHFTPILGGQTQKPY